MTEYRLSVDELSAGYRGPIVSSVSFSVNSGQIVAVVGVNGAGKSTILKAIMGEAQVYGGRVTYCSEDVTRRDGHYLSRRGVGYVPQLNDVFPGLSVTENLKMGGYLISRRMLAERVSEMFARFPALAYRRRVAAQKLSGGERKQLAVARALISGPKVLLLDEPTANLAPNLAEEFLSSYIRNLANEGRGIVLVEQRVDAVLANADHACLVGGGRMWRAGPAAEIRDVVSRNGLLTGPAADGSGGGAEAGEGDDLMGHRTSSTSPDEGRCG
jgi:ABC-type branched-subunit amino acid transport system ATPase component